MQVGKNWNINFDGPYCDLYCGALEPREGWSSYPGSCKLFDDMMGAVMVVSRGNQRELRIQRCKACKAVLGMEMPRAEPIVEATETIKRRLLPW